MTNRFSDDTPFHPFSNRLKPSAHNFILNNAITEDSCGVTVVIEKTIISSFNGPNPLIQIESSHATLETELTSRVVVFIPGFTISDFINITLSGDDEDLERIMVYTLLEDPSGENMLSITSDES